MSETERGGEYTVVLGLDGTPQDEQSQRAPRWTFLSGEEPDELALPAAPADLVRDLQDAVTAGRRLQALGAELHVDVADLVEALRDAIAAPPPGSDEPDAQLSDGEADALRRAGLLTRPMPAFRDRASTRAAVATSGMIADSLSVEEVAAKLDRSSVRIRQRLNDGTLLGVRSGRTWRVPQFQFNGDTELPGWDKVMAAFPRGTHPLQVQAFLDRPVAELDAGRRRSSPREWLAGGGDVDPVVELARGIDDLP